MDQTVLLNSTGGWKTCEMRARQGANRNEVRPRTAEQGPHLSGCDPGAGCKCTSVSIASLCTPSQSHPQRGPCSALRCAHLVRIRNTAWRRFSSGFRQVINGTAHSYGRNVVNSMFVWVQQIDPVTRHERCSDDESDSYPWIGYHLSPIRRGNCLALASWINPCGVPG